MTVTGTEPFCRDQPPNLCGQQFQAYPIVPYDHVLSMCGSNEVVVLPIPFDLSARCTPGAKSHERLFSHPQIPPSDPGIHRDRSHEVRVASVPIDISDSSSVGVDRSEQDPRGLGCQIPYKQLLRRGRQDEVRCCRVRRPLTACPVSSCSCSVGLEDPLGDLPRPSLRYEPRCIVQVGQVEDVETLAAS